MEWNGLCGPGEQAVAALPSVTFTRDVPTYLLRLTGTWEDFKAGRSRNVKESVRKCYNSLKRDNYAFTFEVHRAREELRPALERLIALHAQRAELTDTIPHTATSSTRPPPTASSSSCATGSPSATGCEFSSSGSPAR
jgi:hypothetical protein